MIEYPIVLVLSEGSETPENIIERIRELPSNENVKELQTEPSSKLLGYVFHLTTKYYKTNIFLVPFKEDIALVPGEIQEQTEGVLIYFNSGDRSFCSKIPKYAEFIKENDIELGILLCDTLYDDSNEGITYKEAKQECKFLDVIELGRTKDENEDDDDPHDAVGYKELLQALKSFLWSNAIVGNVNIPGIECSSNSNHQNTEHGSNDGTTENVIEAELAVFEKLLTEVMMFKNATSSLSRNERLAYAQNFADKFEKLIEDNSSDENN